MRACHRFIGYLLAATALAMAPACSGTFTAGTVRTGDYRVEGQRRAYARGYDVGVPRGRSDAREGRPVDYDRHKEFRDATNGYDRRDGDRDTYREAYRNGFRTGYDEGYRAAASNRDRDDDRDRRRPR